ncbi:MAG: galactokinase family protein [Candidatus Marinimicrobia bacterium]|nr:galactokinase family protein [Candidatus Neomarinimicrobiota bacterium]
MAEYDSLVSKTRTEYRTIFDSDPEVIAIAPGRINIIGEHTDYNGGLWPCRRRLIAGSAQLSAAAMTQ